MGAAAGTETAMHPAGAMPEEALSKGETTSATVAAAATAEATIKSSATIIN